MSTTRDFVGCKAKRQMDLLVKPNNGKLSKIVHD